MRRWNKSRFKPAALAKMQAHLAQTLAAPSQVHWLDAAEGVEGSDLADAALEKALRITGSGFTLNLILKRSSWTRHGPAQDCQSERMSTPNRPRKGLTLEA